MNDLYRTKSEKICFRNSGLILEAVSKTYGDHACNTTIPMHSLLISVVHQALPL